MPATDGFIAVAAELVAKKGVQGESSALKTTVDTVPAPGLPV
jgi:hypothetical protein